MASLFFERATVLLPPKHRVRIDRRKLALGTAALLIGIGAAWYALDWWTVGRFIETTDDAYVGGDVTVIAPKVAGLIAEVAVSDNQSVHAGDLLVKLDDRDYKAALSKAEAAVARQKATLADLDATRALQQARIAEAEAVVVAADAETARARDDQARYQRLVREQNASVQAFQKADAVYKQALADGAKARAAVQATQRQIAVIDAQKLEAESALDGAIADRDTARLNLGYTEIRAPIDGAVGNRSARTGAYATVGAQLLSIVPSHGLWIDANFKENQLAHMKPGMPVAIAADAVPGRTLHGRVASLAPATGAQFSVLPPENATGNFTKIVQRVPVRIRLDDGAATLGTLRPGLSTTVAVDTRPDRTTAP